MKKKSLIIAGVLALSMGFITAQAAQAQTCPNRIKKASTVYIHIPKGDGSGMCFYLPIGAKPEGATRGLCYKHNAADNKFTYCDARPSPTIIEGGCAAVRCMSMAEDPDVFPVEPGRPTP